VLADMQGACFSLAQSLLCMKTVKSERTTAAKKIYFDGSVPDLMRGHLERDHLHFFKLLSARQLPQKILVSHLKRCPEIKFMGHTKIELNFPYVENSSQCSSS